MKLGELWPFAVALAFSAAFFANNMHPPPPPEKDPQVACIEQRGAWVWEQSLIFWRGSCEFPSAAKIAAE